MYTVLLWRLISLIFLILFIAGGKKKPLKAPKKQQDELDEVIQATLFKYY